MTSLDPLHGYKGGYDMLLRRARHENHNYNYSAWLNEKGKLLLDLTSTTNRAYKHFFTIASIDVSDEK